MYGMNSRKFFLVKDKISLRNIIWLKVKRLIYKYYLIYTVRMSAKDQGTEQFKLKNFDKAIEFYTQAITENPSDHTIYGNRSAAYTNLKKF